MTDATRKVVFEFDASVGPLARPTLEAFGKEITDMQAMIDRIVAESQAKIAALQTSVQAVVNSSAAATVTTSSQLGQTPVTSPTLPAVSATEMQAVSESEAAKKLQAALEEQARIRNEALEKERAYKAERAKLMEAMEQEAMDYANLTNEFKALLSSVGIEEIPEYAVEYYTRATDSFIESQKKYQVFVAEIEKETQKEADAHRKKVDSTVKELERQLEAEEKARKKREEQERREAEREAERAQKEAEREAERAHRQREREAAATEAEFDRLVQMASTARRSIVTELGEGTSAVLRIMRGITALGLVGERDIGKVTDAMLKMQSTMDLINGTIQSLQRVEQLYRSIRTAIDAAAAAQAIYNATSAAGSAVGSATASKQIAREVGGGVAGGLTGYVLGKSGQVIMSGVGAATTGLATVGGLAVTGAAAAGFTGAAGAGAVTIGATTIGAFASAVFAFVSSVETFKQAAKYGIGGGAEDDSFANTIGTSSWNPFALGIKTATYDPWTRGADETRIQRMMAAREENAEDVAIRNGLLSQQLEIQKQLSQLTDSMRAMELDALKPLERRNVIMASIADYQAQMESYKPADLLDGEKSNEYQVLLDRVIEWQNKRLQNEREISREKRTAAQNEEAAARTAYEHAVRTREEFERSRMTAAERFGMMGDDEQQDVLDIRTRFASGDAALTGEDLSKIRGFDDSTDEEIRRWATERASRAGFGGVFGGAAADRKLAEMRELENTLEIELKQKQEIVVNVDMDLEKTTKEIIEKINEIRQQNQADLQKQLDSLSERDKQAQQRIINRAIGGR